MKDGVLRLYGIRNASENVAGLDGSFTFCQLGEPIRIESLLTGEGMPSFDALARYVFYTATGQSLETVAKTSADGFIGETELFRIHLFYRPDSEWLRSNEAALNADKVEIISKNNATKKRSIVFAVAKFMSQKDLTQKILSFVSYHTPSIALWGRDMELKDYQNGVLDKLDYYLKTLAESKEEAEDFVAFQK